MTMTPNSKKTGSAKLTQSARICPINDLMHIALHNLKPPHRILFRYTTGRIGANDHGHGIGIILLAIAIQPPSRGGGGGAAFVFRGMIVFGKECHRAGGEIGESNTIDAASGGGGGVGGGGLGPLEAVDEDAAEFVVGHGLDSLGVAGVFVWVEQ
jgi:hypothetical protein